MWGVFVQKCQLETRMTIKSCSSLSKRAIEDVLNLESVCMDHDNLQGSFFLDPSLNFNHRIKSFFLLYDKSNLISMLSMFIPTELEAEITAYTLPKFRGKGFFKSLLAKAVKELGEFNVPEVLFVCESSSVAGKRVVDSFEAGYDHTEYYMSLDNVSYTSLQEYRLRLLKVEKKDLEKTIITNMKVFSDSYEESENLIINRFKLKHREQFLGILGEVIIGIVSVNLEGEGVSIFGLGIEPEYRCKGYGKELLHLIIDNLLQRGRSEINIEVNSENAEALKLYKSTGFHIEIAYEYYRLKLVKEVIEKLSSQSS
ncbi:Acetyltransferase (GNAT) family protein [Desulfosporosinus hippei DSM 8344]|uniref:Acetyltransferase (GNAT) family protein n=2 Tax=Desulfosporosinus TaxID=79206 RepID=A0A1G8K0B1_9FIRM|nr:Acetyltransferase (GNAT) family protein [Desulfosporosinus hippei DSM 8344]